MKTATARRELLSVEAYLEGEQYSEIRHEYIAGEVYARSDSSEAHNLICGNLSAALHQHLRGTSRQLFINTMKVHLKIGADDLFYYPDLLVSCSADDRDPYCREKPALIVEILSPSTERIDRHEKFHAYRQIETLEEYLLISQTAREATLFRRATGWRPQREGETLRLDAAGLDFTLPFDRLYEEVFAT